MVRTLALVAALIAASACASFGGAEFTSVPPARPNPSCADKVANAVTDPYGITTGASACFEIPGASLSDGDLEDFAGIAPVFDRIDAACGYYPVRKDYVYVASNTATGERGFVAVIVNARSKATDAQKFLIRASGESGPVTCP